MSLLLVPLALLAVLAAGWLLWRHRSASRAPALPQGRPLRTPVPVAPAAPRTPKATPGPGGDDPSAAPLLPPESVGSFRWLLADDLPIDRRHALVSAVGSIRRPPAALHQLLSPQFLDRATSQALSELINGEAQIAAKVLATVNAPYYGLQRPVGSIGQAVTFLGLNTVRSICLRDLLDASFPAGNPALQAAYRDIWNASALASELCNRLSGRLGLPDSGALVAQVLLSFLGHLATVTLLAGEGKAALPPGAPLLDRTAQAQAALGLGAAEIGALLLRTWGLPATIVDEVRAIDRLLVSPAGAPLDPDTGLDGPRLALAHLCARLGEQLVTAGPAAGPAGAAGLEGMAMGLAASDHGFHLRQHLAHPVLARLGEHLRATDLAQQVLVLQQGMLAQR